LKSGRDKKQIFCTSSIVKEGLTVCLLFEKKQKKVAMTKKKLVLSRLLRGNKRRKNSLLQYSD
jgi:hypothetical protein